jgi:DNA-binding transcriptional LysR family regulator
MGELYACYWIEIADNVQITIAENATMDRLDAMQLFVRVAELGSFSGAAQQLGVARSVVTRQIAGLEAHLGVKLMARSTRRLTLTSAGTAYLEKCRVILNLVEAAEIGVAEERQTPRGNIRISLPLSFGLKRLAPLLLDFSQRYPEVALDMDYSDRRVNLIEEGYRPVDSCHPPAGCRRRGPPYRRQPHAGAGLAGLPVAPRPAGPSGRTGPPRLPRLHQCRRRTTWQFIVDGQLENFPIRSRINANNGDVLTEAAAQGLGIACQPDFIAGSFIAAGRVVEILVDYPGRNWASTPCCPATAMPHRVRVLMDFLAARLAP